MKSVSDLEGRQRGAASGRFTALYLLLVLLSAFLALYVVRDFSGPMILPLDAGQYAFTSYYFSQNISWLPIPHLNLDTPWTGYPYGLDHAFLHGALNEMFSTRC